MIYRGKKYRVIQPIEFMRRITDGKSVISVAVYKSGRPGNWIYYRPIKPRKKGVK